MLFSEFITEMHEILREAKRTNATDSRGRNVELYYGDMMRRLVNERIAHRPKPVVRRSRWERTEPR